MAITNTIRLLKKAEPDRDKIKKYFAKRTDQKLLGALANPEHSEAARVVLREIVQERGLLDEEERGWARSEQAMYVAPFGRRPTFEQALAAPRRRRLVYRTLQFVMLICVFGFFFGLSQTASTYALWVVQGIERKEVDPDSIARFRAMPSPPNDEKIYNYLHGLNLFTADLLQNYSSGLSRSDSYIKSINAFGERQIRGAEADFMSKPDDQKFIEAFIDLSSIEVENYINLQGSLDANAFAFDHFTSHPPFEPQGPRTPESENIAFSLLVIGPLLWFFGGIFSWLRPRRILLLRPFQAKKISRPLKRFARKNLAFYGHTITLSDKHVKESFLQYAVSWIPRHPVDFIVIPLFFLPSIRQFQRWVRVSGPSSYRFLKNRLARRFTMNMFWQNSFGKLLKVKCSDVWWKQAVDLLMYSCQIIVVDMSWVKEGTEWELEKIDRRDLERKTVFVVSESAAEYAREVIDKFWPYEEAPPPLYVYRNSGKVVDKEGYQQEIARIVNESHLWDGPQMEPTKAA